MKLFHLGILLILIGTTSSLLGQHIDFRSPKESWSLGYSVIDEQLPEGTTYNPVILLGNYPIWSRKRLSIYAEGQLTKAYSLLNFRTDIEFGVNMGISFFVIQSPNLSITAAIGSGPHFITVETGRQSNGFIFSDNLELGSQYELRSVNTTLLLKLRYRHISNAGLKEPNGGIDNFFIIAGLSSRL